LEDVRLLGFADCFDVDGHNCAEGLLFIFVSADKWQFEQFCLFDLLSFHESV